MATHTEVPGLKSAVSKLEELGVRMRSDDFGFHENDVANINKVIEALHELEQERKRLHDELETETIKASVNRHKLQFLPSQIKDEIMVAVNSARQSNAKAQQELQDKLDNINKNIINLGLKQQELEKENSVLHPERELVRQQHEEIISQLNQRMAEKASLQIALNETRDKVRQANQSIVNLEDGILQLKEDLIQERTEARHEKKRLKKAVADTAEKTRDQREQNMGKKKELDSVEEILTNSENSLDSLRKSIRRYETTKSRLEEEENTLNAKQAKELKIVSDLQEKGVFIKNETEREQAVFKAQAKDLNQKTERFEKDIKDQEEMVKQLELTKMDLQVEVRERMTIKANDANRIEALDVSLQIAKKNLSQKAEEVGTMHAENVEMTDQIETIADSHQAVVAQLNKQLEEFREQLNIERKERMELQSRKDSVQKNMEDHKTDQQRYMQTVNQQIQEGKTKHVELSNEGAQIQKDLRKDEEEIRQLQGQLTQVEQCYQEMFNSLHTKTKTMEEEIVSMETELTTKASDGEAQTPVFKEFEAAFDERTQEYDKMKKDVVVLKNKKISLEDAIVKAKREKEALEPIQAELRENLKQIRSESLSQMKGLGEEMQETEQKIFLEGSKLKTVMEENHRFRESCKKLEEDILDIQKQMALNEKLTTELQQELVKSKEDLVQSWEADQLMQKLFADRDKEKVEAFGRLLEKTGKRETTISDVTGRLSGELQTLAHFLDNVSSRRPRDTRSGKRPHQSSQRPLTSSSRGHNAVDVVAAANLSSGTPKPPSLGQSRQSSRMLSRPTTVASRTTESLGDTPREKSSPSPRVVTVSART